MDGNPVNWFDPEGLEGWFYGYNSWGMPQHPSSSVMWDKLSEEEQCKEQEAWLKEPPSDEFFENLMAGIFAGGGIKNVIKRLTRGGDDAVRVIYNDGRILDISAKRVKEFVPNTHPNAPPGTLQKVKFDNALPGSKGYKRSPTIDELKFLE